jgi:hypothetical protein
MKEKAAGMGINIIWETSMSDFESGLLPALVINFLHLSNGQVAHSITQRRVEMGKSNNDDLTRDLLLPFLIRRLSDGMYNRSVWIVEVNHSSTPATTRVRS